MATLSPERVVKEKSEEDGGRFLISSGDHQRPVKKDALLMEEDTTRIILCIVQPQLLELSGTRQ